MDIYKLESDFKKINNQAKLYFKLIQYLTQLKEKEEVGIEIGFLSDMNVLHFLKERLPLRLSPLNNIISEIDVFLNLNELFEVSETICNISIHINQTIYSNTAVTMKQMELFRSMNKYYLMKKDESVFKFILNDCYTLTVESMFLISSFLQEYLKRELIILNNLLDYYEKNKMDLNSKMYIKKLSRIKDTFFNSAYFVENEDLLLKLI